MTDAGFLNMRDLEVDELAYSKLKLPAIPVSGHLHLVLAPADGRSVPSYPEERCLIISESSI